jgi:cytochrome c-type biogenesis protein CcmH/NrfG
MRYDVNDKKAAAVAGSVGLAFVLLFWLISRAGQSTPPPPAKTSDAVAGATRVYTPEQDREYLEGQLERRPTDVPTLLKLGEVTHQMGDRKASKQYFERAIQSNPQLLRAHLQLSLVLNEMGDPAGAERENRSVLAQDPDNLDALYNLGAMAASRGDTAQARQYWEQVLTTGPSTETGHQAAKRLGELGR